MKSGKEIFNFMLLAIKTPVAFWAENSYVLEKLALDIIERTN